MTHGVNLEDQQRIQFAVRRERERDAVAAAAAALMHRRGVCNYNEPITELKIYWRIFATHDAADSFDG